VLTDKAAGRELTPEPSTRGKESTTSDTAENLHQNYQHVGKNQQEAIQQRNYTRIISTWERINKKRYSKEITPELSTRGKEDTRRDTAEKLHRNPVFVYVCMCVCVCNVRVCVVCVCVYMCVCVCSVCVCVCVCMFRQ
jgi:hypothetical protein